MSNQLMIGNFTQDDITTMQATIAKGTTPAQFNLFIRTAAASGLNPFLNHIYCIVYGQTMNIQISVEGIVFLAKKVDGFQGIDVQLVHDNDEFEASIDREGKWSIDAHKFKFPRGKVIGGYAIAYRDGFKPFTVFMEVTEVEHNLRGNNKALWEKYFNDFFKKHMVKRAAKGQFGIDISEDDNGTTAEPNINNVESYTRVDVTPPDAPVESPKENKAPNTPQAQKDAKKEPTEAEKMKAINEQIQANFFKLGIEDNGIAAYIQGHFPQLEAGKKLTYQQKQTLVKIMESEIELKSELAEELE